MNSNSSNHPAETPDIYARMIEAQASTSREAEANRPDNTKRSYASKQKEFREWCDEAFSSVLPEYRYTVVNRTSRRNTGKSIKYSTAISADAFVETDVEPTEVLLQRAMPLLYKKLEDTQNEFNALRREMLTEFRAIQQKMDDLVSGRTSLRFFREDEGERAGIRPMSTPSLPSPAINTESSSQQPAEYFNGFVSFIATAIVIFYFVKLLYSIEHLSKEAYFIQSNSNILIIKIEGFSFIAILNISYLLS
ncbi:hypothetical protein PHYBLDRAFT_161619 [Phycomyces blakesleeanus NRRL 1555(-)]|uniref:Uncharacterized protein n=1 Tax=Phycomyces blakesleeanus (strain ATCC 8743b / DSM 1359 / FGSC 10004 / NBRC 33097 / NRRL 1555) TaxID=763407 RepID=A0A162Q8I2_PHYB8|nr:hypothetical protein PHYBLDRAFT_161619 [Phycomyces blakesleeanus NRRL 1555(-)]OAD80986.1 hypothetical protein PHYBLDRAFT_161619 [Phycomyces blakesleeanus NRRL 1555(-)]|eukprot:XP_018299026.1 hypothetical protein PHYBLDRAFT_161619 [Phycomyces blakesleeanus NRRL 1555(-)]